ncbi:MAG TPA: long-chain fatty acid--CoA ligase [Ktedonobacterales bacterium]
MLNLAMLLEDNASKYPDREAIVFGDTRLTYARLNAAACQVANGLRALGIGPGDKVALSCPNVPHFPIAYYGILKAGAAAVPLNVLLSSWEIAYHLNDSDAKAYFCFEGGPGLPLDKTGHAGFAEADVCQHFILMTADPAAATPFEGTTTITALTHGQPATFATAATAADDIAVILYTSGTTGQPKGAELTHSNMLMNAMVSRDLYLPKMRERNVGLMVLPLFHVFGMTVVLNAILHMGGTLVLLARFEPAAALETIVRERVTFFSGVPTMYWGLLNHAQTTGADTKALADHLRLCISGGSALPVELLRNFESAFGVEILEGYGLSETSPVVCFNQLGFERKPGSIGRPVFGTEMRVVDDNDQDVPTGQPGEIVIRGHSVMNGYYKRPEATAEAMRGGWFHTGDIAYQDADGYFFIVDRKKDMILRGGYNVYPRELEEVLMTHPAVSLAAVIGLPHASLGQEVKAFIIRKSGATVTAEEMIAWSREQVAQYKYPRHIEFRDTLPMTATGKVLKRELADQEARPEPAR